MHFVLKVLKGGSEMGVVGKHSSPEFFVVSLSVILLRNGLYIY